MVGRPRYHSAVRSDAATQRPHPVGGRLARLLLLALLGALTVAGCGGPASDSPTGVARLALERLGDGDLEGLGELACTGQADLVRERLGLAGNLADLLPGFNVDALVQALRLDTGGLAVDDETISGDRATVRVHGDVALSFDAEVMRPILRQVIEAQGGVVDDQMLDALLAGLRTFARDVPLDETLTLVREEGAWRICLPAP
jgi:hypothetical protein